MERSTKFQIGAAIVVISIWSYAAGFFYGGLFVLNEIPNFAAQERKK